MDSTRRLSSFRHRVAWLLWLALLAPLAQSAAALHAYSHVGTQASERRDHDQATQATHCDLCLMAAALAGGAWVSEQARLPLAAGPDSIPRAAADSGWQGLATPGYRSRAPPLSSL